MSEGEGNEQRYENKALKRRQELRKGGKGVKRE